MEIITGRTGTPHVYAADDAEIYKLFLGDGDYRLTTGNQLSASLINPQSVRISDGSIMMQGRLAKIRSSDGFDIVELDSGTVGWKRADLIVAEYNQTTETRQEEIDGEVVTITDVLESVELKVVKGTPNQTSYIAPAVTTGNIDLGQTHQVPLWEVRFDGINNNGLIDRRPALLDTTPIQAAISLARGYTEQIYTQMEHLRTEVYNYATELRSGITSKITGSYKGTYTGQDTDVDTVNVPLSGYVANAADYKTVYLNGLRLTEDEVGVSVGDGFARVLFRNSASDGYQATRTVHLSTDDVIEVEIIKVADES